MTARIQNATVQPDVTAGVQHLFKAIYSGGVPRQTLELVHLRASQINGCSACVDADAASAAKAGVSPEKLLALAAWYENPLFDDAERAALALTEAATRLSDRPGAVTDEIWAEAAKHYDEQQLGALTLMVAITNFFNRITPPCGCQPALGGTDTGRAPGGPPSPARRGRYGRQTPFIPNG